MTTSALPAAQSLFRQALLDTGQDSSVPPGKERAVGEESHLDEMRSAIRGDFERLASRWGEQELLRVSDEAEADEEPFPDEPEADEELDAAEAEPELPRRSWLARLLAP